MTQQAVLHCEQLSKRFTDGAATVDVLHQIDFSLFPKESVAIMGASGSGKSTLLQLLGALDKPTSGKISLVGQDLTTLNDKQLSALRNQYLGFVYQFHHLLPEFTVIENVCLPLLIRKTPVEEARAKAKKLLELVGLGKRIEHKIGEISGGERQRTAIARALVNEPKCLLADEPTGNLDTKTSHEIMVLLSRLNASGKTIVMVTHENDIASWSRRIVRMRDGEVESDLPNTPEPIDFSGPPLPMHLLEEAA